MAIKINLAQAWTYRTTELTIPYPAGEHQVTAAIRGAAKAEGVIAEEDGADERGLDDTIEAQGNGASQGELGADSAS